MKEPKPCPFCGGTQVEIVAVFPDEFVIVCEDCGIAVLPANGMRCGLDELIERWNRRAGE